MIKDFEITAKVKENTCLLEGPGLFGSERGSIWRMVLEGSFSTENRVGRFVNLSLPGFFLRRPISISDFDLEKGTLTLVYKVVGEGTELMASYPSGTEVKLLQGLGNGFCLEKAGEHPLLVGGGVGTAPLYALAKALRGEGRNVTVILGFNTKAEVFYKEEFEKLGCRVLIATMDGTEGTKGFVTDCLKEAGEYTYYYACGPMPMLKALLKAAGTVGELSLEARMGCGFGACVGCSIETTEGFKKVCSDGPVFDAALMP